MQKRRVNAGKRVGVRPFTMFWAFGLILFLIAVPVFAQLATGTILGVVKDTSGGTVAGANVTVTNTETTQTRTVTTEADGSYRFPGVPAGHYTVKIEKDGFKTSTQTGLVLDVSANLVVNGTMEVGSSAQEVTVTGEAPLVNTTTSALGGLVDENKMADLPLNGRNYMDLSVMQPGTSQNKAMGNSHGTVGVWYSSNGAPVRSNMVSLDGANMMTLLGGAATSEAGTTLGLDGIREIKVVTTSFSAAQPARHPGTVAGFNVTREDPAAHSVIVIEPVHAGINQPDHILGTARLGLALVLRFVKFADQIIQRTIGQPALPEFHGNGAGATGDAGTVHGPEIRLDLHHHHGAGRLGIVAGHERLVNPAARELQAVGNGAEQSGNR